MVFANSTTELNFDLAVQLPNTVAHSGIYKFQMQVRLVYQPTQSPIQFLIPDVGLAYPYLLLANSGYANVLVRDRQSSDYLGCVFDDKSAWGKGWSLSSAPRLVLEENNDLLWSDSYGTRRWTMKASDRTTWDAYRKSSQTFTYNGNDQLTNYNWLQADATINTTYAYWPNQLLKTEENGLTGITRYFYDANFAIDYTTDPYDLLGRNTLSNNPLPVEETWGHRYFTGGW